jgi:hypothetical protein
MCRYIEEAEDLEMKAAKEAKAAVGKEGADALAAKASADAAAAEVAALKDAAMAPLRELTETLERAAVWGAAVGAVHV